MSEYPYRPLVAWMVANRVPDDWADDALILVDEVCGEIQVEMFMRHPDGGMMLHGSTHVFTEMRTFPMLVPPPPGLLQAYERMRTSLREERSAVAALERKTIDTVIAELWEGGHRPAAEWLASRRVANPAPTRQLVPFRAECARIGRMTLDGRRLTTACEISVRERAPLYSMGGSIIGDLASVDVDTEGVVWLLGQALPLVAKRLNEGRTFPSIDGRTKGEAGDLGLLSHLEIAGAMEAEIATYPWRNDQIGGPDVGT